MFPVSLGLTGLFDIGSKLIERLIPDPSEQEKAKLKLAKLAQDGEFRELEARMNAIIAEAKSSDPWTSRARPAFMYVFYILLLWSIPMGFAFVFVPDQAERFTEGFKLWIGAIPEPIIWLFGSGYLGYTTARSIDKRNIISGKK